MRGWLIYNQSDADQNKSYISWFQEEAHLQNIRLRVLMREDLTIGVVDNKRTVLLHGKPVRQPDFAVIRTIEPLLNLQLESLGITVYNSAEMATICNNKALTHLHVSKLGIPMADTVFTTEKTGFPTDPPSEFPFVIKDVHGRGGSQVKMVSSLNDWQHQLLHPPKGDLIIQSAKNIQPGKDVRVFVIGNKIIGAVLRENKQDFRANYKLGGTASWYNLNTSEKALVQQICSFFQFGMVGIDFLLDCDGRFIFNEIEDVVGSRTLSAVSDINIVKEYLTYIKSRSPK